MKWTVLKGLAILLLGLRAVPCLAGSLGMDKALALVKVQDERQHNTGDFKATAFVKDTERGKDPTVSEVEYYRRDRQDKFLILFLAPRDQAGQGYLKIDRNLWFYDPGTGKWDRRTERERIGGTNSRRADYDEPHFIRDFDVHPLGVEPLGDYTADVISLTAKADVDVPYPIQKLWIDDKDDNILERQEYSLSGRLMRTTYYPSWIKRYSASKGADVWTPREIRIFDDLEKGDSTIILIKAMDLNPLDDAMFTKAWIEAKSR